MLGVVKGWLGFIIPPDLPVDTYTRSLVLVFLCFLMGAAKFISLLQVLSSHQSPSFLKIGILIFWMQLICIPFLIKRLNFSHTPLSHTPLSLTLLFFSPLTSHLSPLTSHLSPLTSYHLSPLITSHTSHLSPLITYLPNLFLKINSFPEPKVCMFSRTIPSRCSTWV
jgi:hypothetical protein